MDISQPCSFVPVSASRRPSDARHPGKRYATPSESRDQVTKAQEQSASTKHLLQDLLAALLY
jgi:hypothetical protein